LDAGDCRRAAHEAGNATKAQGILAARATLADANLPARAVHAAHTRRMSRSPARATETAAKAD
jgi:hypothetical protein